MFCIHCLTLVVIPRFLHLTFEYTLFLAVPFNYTLFLGIHSFWVYDVNGIYRFFGIPSNWQFIDFGNPLVLALFFDIHRYWQSIRFYTFILVYTVFFIFDYTLLLTF